MKWTTERRIYERIIETAEWVFEDFEHTINTIGVRGKARMRLLRVAKKHNRIWKHLCLELSGTSLKGLRRAKDSQERRKRRDRLKVAGVPAWKRNGWKSEQKYRNYHRVYMHWRRAKKRR